MNLVTVCVKAFLASCEHFGNKHPSPWYSAIRRLSSAWRNSLRSSDFVYLSSSAISHSRYSLVIFCIVLYFRFTYIIGILPCLLCNAIRSALLRSSCQHRIPAQKLGSGSRTRANSQAAAGSQTARIQMTTHHTSAPRPIESLNLRRKPHRKAETVRQSRKKGRGPLDLKRVSLYL